MILGLEILFQTNWLTEDKVTEINEHLRLILRLISNSFRASEAQCVAYDFFVFCPDYKVKRQEMLDC